MKSRKTGSTPAKAANDIVIATDESENVEMLEPLRTGVGRPSLLKNSSQSNHTNCDSNQVTERNGEYRRMEEW